jgi:hypothetical protein
MSSSIPTNSVKNNYTIFSLVKGDVSVEWPTPPFKKRQYEHSFVCSSDSNYGFTVNFARYYDGLRGWDGHHWVFSTIINGTNRLIFANDVWDLLLTDGSGSTFLDRSTAYKDGTGTKEFADHGENEYLYYVDWAKEPVTKAEVNAFYTRMAAAKAEMIERTKRWNPVTCSRSINELRAKNHPKDGVYCDCGHPAAASCVKNPASPNRGQWFWTCIVSYGISGRCSFFDWVNEKSPLIDSAYGSDSSKDKRRAAKRPHSEIVKK